MKYLFNIFSYGTPECGKVVILGDSKVKNLDHTEGVAIQSYPGATLVLGSSTL